MDDYTDPSKTVLLLDELVRLGLTDDDFSRIHHFKVPEKISRHRRYCVDLAEESGRFRTNNNRLVQRRLDLILRLFRAGNFESSSAQIFTKLADISMIEYPHDLRSLAEQYVELAGGEANAA